VSIKTVQMMHELVSKLHAAAQLSSSPRYLGLGIGPLHALGERSAVMILSMRIEYILEAQ